MSRKGNDGFAKWICDVESSRAHPAPAKRGGTPEERYQPCDVATVSGIATDSCPSGGA